MKKGRHIKSMRARNSERADLIRELMKIDDRFKLGLTMFFEGVRARSVLLNDNRVTQFPKLVFIQTYTWITIVIINKNGSIKVIFYYNDTI